MGDSASGHDQFTGSVVAGAKQEEECDQTRIMKPHNLYERRASRFVLCRSTSVVLGRCSAQTCGMADSQRSRGAALDRGGNASQSTTAAARRGGSWTWVLTGWPMKGPLDGTVAAQLVCSSPGSVSL